MEGQEPEETKSGLSPSPVRRRLLTVNMKQLAGNGINCANCSGLCCTHMANSMQVTPVELRDIIEWLRDQNRLTPELKAKCENTVSRYRLDVEVGHGRRALRKTYTCPFYVPGPTGCTISRSVKPYGCLAFNARSPGASEGSDCGSDQQILEDREQTDPCEPDANEILRSEWSLYWEKAPLPLALLETWDRFARSEGG